MLFPRGAGVLGKLGVLSWSAVAILILSAASSAANAATISFSLTCSLNGLDSSGSCSAGPSFGTITLEDLTGVDAGKVEVTVDLGFPSSQKFRDLILNYAGPATSITDNDPNNSVFLSNNNVSFSINPYNGRFDVGATDQQNWNATTSGPYSTVLSGNVALSTADFTALDSLGNLYAALHIQDIGSASGENCDGTNNPACVPGMNGPGSLKIGAPEFRIVRHEVPEPSALALIVLGLVLAAWRRS
jgi:hypothetical protein